MITLVFTQEQTATLYAGLKKGETIYLRGIGRLHVKEMPPRKYYNPGFEKEMKVPKHKKFVFRPSFKLTRALK